MPTKYAELGCGDGGAGAGCPYPPFEFVLGSVGLVHSASGSLVYSLCYGLVVVAIVAGLVAVFSWAKRREAEKKSDDL